jgi:hypothetical protein
MERANLAVNVNCDSYIREREDRRESRERAVLLFAIGVF